MNIAITSIASKNTDKSNITRSDSSIPSGISPSTALKVETPMLAFSNHVMNELVIPFVIKILAQTVINIE